MTFLEHLEELRMTIFGCVLAFAIATFASLFFYKKIFEILRIPLENALAGTPSENAEAAKAALTSMHFTDPFAILLYIALLGGIVISCPFILFQLGKFVAPALSISEQKKVAPICAAATLLFIAGAALAFFFLAPISIQFMFFFSAEMGLEVNWLAADYYGFVVILMLFVGVIFEFPLVIIALQFLEIVSTKTLLEKWRWVIAAIVISIAVISPIGDPVALLALTAFLFLLYVVAVFVGDFFLKKKLRKRAEDEANFDAEFSAGTTKKLPRGNDKFAEIEISKSAETAFPKDFVPENSSIDSEENGDLKVLD